MEKIYDTTKVNMLLGCLLQDTSLISSDKYPLCKDDFVGHAFDRVMYVSIVNLSRSGYKTISFFDLDKYLQKHEAEYQIFKDCRDKGDVEDFLDTIVYLSDVGNYESYYNDVRKCSVLRDYRDNGFDIEKFYDYNKSETENLKNIEQCSIESIINRFELLQIQMSQKYMTHTNQEEMICGDGFDEILDEYEEEPYIGAKLSQPMIDTVYRGWILGHLIIEGAPSSHGKTLKGAMDLILVGSLKLYDKEKDMWYDNPNYRGKACLIHSEQKSKKEIQPRVCSILAKIPFYKVLDGDFTKEEKKRLSIAGKVLKESGFKIINYPNFTASGITTTLKRLKLEGYEYIVQDYIWSNVFIQADMKKTMGLSNVTEQNALLNFASTLKVVSESLNIACKSFMQLNDIYKTAEIIDESTLYCGRSVKTKVDCGHISTTPTKKQLAQIEPLITAWNKKYNKEGLDMIKPNVLSSVYKSRYSKYGENIKIWSYLDRDIGEITDMFATDVDNCPIKIEELVREQNIIN